MEPGNYFQTSTFFRLNLGLMFIRLIPNACCLCQPKFIQSEDLLPDWQQLPEWPADSP